jgi:hypothetical protein
MHGVAATPAAERIEMLGLTMIVAGIVHFVLTSLQPLHQVPIAAPVVSVFVTGAGLLLWTAGAALAAAWRTAHARSMVEVKG